LFRHREKKKAETRSHKKSSTALLLPLRTKIAVCDEKLCGIPPIRGLHRVLP
jgi:hypothetical protein